MSEEIEKNAKKQENKMPIEHDYDAPASTMAKVAKYELPACIFLFLLAVAIIVMSFVFHWNQPRVQEQQTSVSAEAVTENTQN